MNRPAKQQSAAKHSASVAAGKTVKLRLKIAYDGTHYSGWQLQKGDTSVQEMVELALGKIVPGHHRLHSSSRTDTGVHALGMVAHVEVPKAKFQVSGRKFRLALNAHLPEDIRIVTVTRAKSDFHARFDAKGKQYRYYIWNHPAMNPLLRTTAWHVPQSLDHDLMRAAASRFVGKHDFRSFAANRGYDFNSTVRTLTRCDIKRSGPLLTVVIEGDGFLYRMCRGMVGTLVQIGRGKFQPESIKAMLEHKDRRVAGMTAPAHGLVLWKVNYGSSK